MDQPSHIFEALEPSLTLMAATEAVPVKQLGELLKEQQEPFTLETYLSERRNRVTDSGSSKHQIKKPRNGNLLPKLFKAVYNKLFRFRNSDEPAKIIISTCVNGSSFSLHGQGKTETDESMSSSASTTYSTTISSNSSSDIDTEQDDDQREKEVDDGDGSTCRWRIIMEETKDQSPVSVLQNITSQGVSKLLHNVLLKPAEPTKRIITEDSILSASLWNILLQYSETQVHGPVNSSSSQSLMTKQVLEHNGQLLFDCVSELTDGKQKTTNCRSLLGSEEIGKLICRKINAWGKQAEDKTHATDLDLGLDFCRGIEEQKSEIGLVIGDAILEKVTDEIVLDMVINLTNV